MGLGHVAVVPFFWRMRRQRVFKQEAASRQPFWCTETEVELIRLLSF